MVLIQHCFPFRTTLFSLEHTVLNVLFMYQTSIHTFKTDWVESSTQSNLVIHNYFSTEYPVFCHPYCTSVLYQLSSLTILYFILGVKSRSPTFLVEISANWRPPSHRSILCILHFSPFLTKCIILEMWLVCLVYLPFLDINTADLPSNITRGASYGIIYGSLFNNSWINTMKCAKAIPAAKAAFYPLYALDWATGPGTCVTWSIGPPW